MMKRVSALGPALWPLRRTGAAQRDEIGQAVNQMAWPVIIENLLQTLMGVVDMVMVGALGAAALAGVGSSLQVVFVIQSAFAAVTTGTTVLVAYAIGAGRSQLANRVLKQSLLIGAAMSAL